MVQNSGVGLTMEESVLSSLKTISYEVSNEVFRKCIIEAPKSVEYSKIVNYLTNELRSLCSIDEEVNVITTPEDSVSFMLEVSSFLKELGCPYSSLAQGPLADRLNNVEDKILLLDFLISELLASRIAQQGKPDKQIQLKVQETPEAYNLQTILKTLRFSKPPENLTVTDIFEKLLVRAEAAVTERGKDLIGNPIWKYQLNEKDWDKLNMIQNELHNEYTIRRKMMLQRLDCTIQSFQWSDKMKSKGDIIMKTYSGKRKQLKVDPEIDISSLLAAREDLAIIEKTSNSSVRKNTRSQVNKVVIGKVPDRGGRTSEQAPPPPEMPSWQQRQAGPSGGRGGNRGGGGRGGRGDQSNYQRGGYSNSGQQNNDRPYQKQQQSFDSAGSYSNSYNNGGYNQQNQQYYQDNYQHDAKRPKTYDSFQHQKQTYADQYVQESQYNQQYQPRNNRGRGRGGRGNYHRGGGQNYY